MSQVLQLLGSSLVALRAAASARGDVALELQHERELDLRRGGAGLRRTAARASASAWAGSPLTTAAWLSRTVLTVASGIAIATRDATAIATAPRRTASPGLVTESLDAERAPRPRAAGRPPATPAPSTRGGSQHCRGEEEEGRGQRGHLPDPVRRRRDEEGDQRAGEPGRAHPRLVARPHAQPGRRSQHQQQEGGQEREPDDAGLGERLQVQRVRVLHVAEVRGAWRPQQLVGAGAGPAEQVAAGGVDRHLPVVVAAVAAGGAEARDRVMAAAPPRSGA